MYSLESFSFWLFFLYFLFSSFLSFYIPGSLLLRPLKFPFFVNIILSLVVGMVLWGWQGFVFGFLGARWLSYMYLVVIFFLWFVSRRKTKIIVPKIDIPITFLIVIGTFLQTFVVFFTGLLWKDGIRFCCGAVGDNLYHLGITYQVIRHIPPFDPEMSGELLRNYHYWAHLVIAELSRVFGLPFIQTEFQYMSIFVSLFLGLTIVVLGQIAKFKKGVLFWILFLLYFGGDFIYIVIFLLGRGIHFEMGPLENGVAFLNNFPRSYAIVIFLAGLSFLMIFIQKKRIYAGFIMALLFGSAIGFKVYVGIFGLSGLAVLGLYYLYKKQYKMLIPCFLAILCALLVYLPTNKGSGGLFFTGFWRFEEFIVQPALGLSHMELARRIYLEHNNILHATLFDFIFMALFTFSIFGVKLFGLFQNKKTLLFFPKEFHIFLMSALLINTVVGFFFQQDIGGTNSFNFLVTVYIISSIYAGITFWNLFNKKNVLISGIVLLILILGTIPRIVFEENKNIQMFKEGGSVVPNETLDAYNFFKNNTNKDSIVISSVPSFFTFLSERSVYLGAFGILESHTVDIADRKKTQKTVFTSNDEKKIYTKLVENKINYVYMQSSQELPSTHSARFLKKVYDNTDVKILQFFPHP